MSFEQGLQWMTWLLCWSLGLQCVEYLRYEFVSHTFLLY